MNQLAGQVRASVIAVGRTGLEPAAWRLTEEEAAERILKSIITEEARNFEAPGTVEDRGEIVLKDKKIRFIVFRKETARVSEPVKTDHAVFLYLPPGFAKSHEVYFFWHDFMRPSTGPVKLYKRPGFEAVYAVIDSLKIHQPLEAAEGPEGVLLRSAAAGDLDSVRAAIGQGANVDARIPLWTPLLAAAYYGHLDVIDLLLEQGARIDQAEETMDATPLHAAIVAGEPEIAAALIDRGADVNLRTKDGSSALLFAAPQGYTALVSKLLEKGAAVEASTPEGETPLMFAADGGSIETAGILGSAGADINAQTKSGETALTFAAFRGHRDLVAWLLESGADVNHRCPDGRTPLWRAVDGGDAEVVRKLLAAGANVNARTEDGFTALMMAAEYGLDEIAGLLIEAKADVNIKAGKTTALKLAKSRKHDEIVKRLRAAGAK